MVIFGTADARKDDQASPFGIAVYKAQDFKAKPSS
jgi:hypothetical protein